MSTSLYDRVQLSMSSTRALFQSTVWLWSTDEFVFIVYFERKSTFSVMVSYLWFFL